MQGTAALVRAGARALVLALASLMLVVLGCTGAQASSASLPAASAAVASVAQLAAPQAAGSGPETALVATAGHVQTTCMPGRGKSRVESNAVLPNPVHQQSSSGSAVAPLPRGQHAAVGAAVLDGRIPASPSHLDLGIVRT